MAKVTAPLFSAGASGKFAKALVFFPWKGLNVVRQWLKPANPEDPQQGTMRQILGGTAKAASAVNKAEAYYAELIALGKVVAPQTWISYIVDRAISLYMTDKTTYEALITEYEANAVHDDFETEAGTRGMVDFEIDYAETTEVYTKGLQLYVMAKVAIADDFTIAPYTTALGSWSAANVDTHADNLFGAD
jgi:hypothetical protein